MLAHSRVGNGPPLVLIHGLGGTGAIWDPVIDLLRDRRELLIVDMPGFGASPRLPEGTAATAVNLASSISGLCTELDIETPDVAGNSLGAWVALEMGRTGAARSVTGLSPAGLWRRPLGPRSFDARPFARGLRPLVMAAMSSETVRRRFLATTVARPEILRPAEAREMASAWIDSPGYDDANAEMRAIVFDPTGYPEIPVTIAWAALDRLVAPPRPERMPAGSRYIVLPQVGHMPTWDDPLLVAETLLEGSDSQA